MGDLLHAYHEAGHAVMATKLGCPLSRVTLEESVRQQSLSYSDTLRCRFASFSAEELCPPDADPDRVNDIYGGCLDDLGGTVTTECFIQEYARLYGDPATAVEFAHRERWKNDYGNDLITEVRAILHSEPYKSAIIALANALVEEREIDGPEAKAIIGSALVGGVA